jgi:hypothetical protein
VATTRLIGRVEAYATSCGEWQATDVFVFDRRYGFGQDRIVDFTPGEDRLDLRGLGLEFERVDSDGDGVIGEGDHGVSLQGGDLVVALRGGTIELAGSPRSRQTTS